MLVLLCRRITYLLRSPAVFLLTVVGPEIRLRKAAVASSNEFHHCQAVFVPIDLNNETVSQSANVCNTGRAKTFP